MFEEELAGQCGWREIALVVAEKDSGGEAKEVTGIFSCRPRSYDGGCDFTL